MDNYTAAEQLRLYEVEHALKLRLAQGMKADGRAEHFPDRFRDLRADLGDLDLRMADLRKQLEKAG